jgi:uncharacterized membrane protein YhaH (DUF805 family)
MEWFDCYSKVLKKYSDFSGRACRKEFWYFWGINIIISFVHIVNTVLMDIVPGILETVLGFVNIIISVYFIAILIPTIAVAVRRLHDINKSGIWFLINFIPFIGGIIFLVLLAQEGNPDVNEFGVSPGKGQAGT